MLDILCIGDSVIDIFLRIPENDSRFKLDKDQNKLYINYGDKISVEKYLVTIGGNATNTSVGLSRLKINTGLCAEIGNDEFSQKIISTLQDEKINTDFLLRDTDKQTSLTVALSYATDRTLFTEHIQRDHNFNLENLQTKMIYLTSLGNIWENAYEKVLNFKIQNNCLLAFNPGSLQLSTKGKIFMNILEHSDYLFVNKQEAEEILYGKELEINLENDKNLIKKLLFGLKSLGAKNVIITDSDNGSYLENENNETYHLDITKVNPVEKTGAGDAYTAGFLGAILNEQDLNQAMIWGAINSSRVIEKIGAQEGLQTKDQLLEIKNTLSNFLPESI